MRTDHSREIEDLRSRASTCLRREKLVLGLLADLLQIHDDTGLSIDLWPNARELIEYEIGEENFKENHA